MSTSAAAPRSGDSSGDSSGVARPATPREAFERVLRGVTGRDWNSLPELYAEDTIVDHPMAIPAPTRIVGREGIRRHFDMARDLPLELSARNVVVHETTDPEVIVAEFDYDGRITTTGRTFTIRNIFVLRVRDGLIVESRDYANHLVLADALGRLPDVTHRPERGHPGRPVTETSAGRA